MVSLITCAPGSDIYMLFGHSAIRVNDGQKDLVYNYGTFDFNTPGFALKFMRGKLLYMLTVTNYGRFLHEYHYDKRGVKEQILELDPKLKQEIIEFLQWNAQPENAYYKYDFFFDNCSSRIRDILSNVTHDSLRFEGRELNISFRDMLHEYLTGYPWTKFGIDLIIGSIADKTASTKEQMFLPDYLMNNMGRARYQNKKVLTSPTPILIFNDEDNVRKKRGWFTPDLIFSILIFIWLALWYYRKTRLLNFINKGVLIAIGMMSLIIIFLWFATDHAATKINYNLIWINPLAFYVLFTKKTNFKQRLILIMSSLTIISMLFSFVGLIPQEHPNYTFSLFLLITYFSLFWNNQRTTNHLKTN